MEYRSEGEAINPFQRTYNFEQGAPPPLQSGAGFFSNGLCQALMKQERSTLRSKPRADEDQLYKRSHMLNLQPGFQPPSEPMDSILKISKCKAGALKDGKFRFLGDDSPSNRHKGKPQGGVPEDNV